MAREIGRAVDDAVGDADESLHRMRGSWAPTMHMPAQMST